ncbi:MAG: methyltransferase domain-containing protein [Anaerolineaceae bacterium]|nr:methyltransferase domain-containing protein [Anaerolineaceae bacterium]
MSEKYPVSEFDDWAKTYDQDVTDEGEFPFIRYGDVLETIYTLSTPQSGMQILDIGTGTGNLAKKYIELGCKVWGTDYSTEMLNIAREKFPQATFLLSDLSGDWPPPGITLKFDRILSAYVLHHFTLDEKVQIIRNFFDNLQEDGVVIIGDLSFRSSQDLAQARIDFSNVWEEEDFWVANETLHMLEKSDFSARYQQVSSCAGIYVIARS